MLMSQQDQFLDVIDRDEADARFRAALSLQPLGAEEIPLEEGLGRSLAEDVLARVDVPFFDRSNYDGFAVRASDTFGASEMSPRQVCLQEGALDAGTRAHCETIVIRAIEERDIDSRKDVFGQRAPQTFRYGNFFGPQRPQ